MSSAAGGIAEVHAIAIREAGHEVAAICDVDLPKAQALAAQCGAEALGDLDVLLADESVGSVVVAVPNCLHSPLAVKALDAGKHVLLENPWPRP